VGPPWLFSLSWASPSLQPDAWTPVRPPTPEMTQLIPIHIAEWKTVVGHVKQPNFVVVAA
jgi:hypothetical protein